ncbi:MAG: sugar ABC transporter permease, partial [Pseudomonadota bacterium]
MSAILPPKGIGPLQKREARLAWSLLFPTIAIVSLVVILPLLAIFWISFKPIGLADLRPPAPIVREALRGSGDDLRVEYRLRNSSQDVEITGVTFSDRLPDEITITGALPERCALNARQLLCDFGTI